jgi:hypothetical protein
VKVQVNRLRRLRELVLEAEHALGKLVEVVEVRRRGSLVMTSLRSASNAWLLILCSHRPKSPRAGSWTSIAAR